MTGHVKPSLSPPILASTFATFPSTPSASTALSTTSLTVCHIAYYRLHQPGHRSPSIVATWCSRCPNEQQQKRRFAVVVLRQAPSHIFVLLRQASDQPNQDQDALHSELRGEGLRRVGTYCERSFDFGPRPCPCPSHHTSPVACRLLSVAHPQLLPPSCQLPCPTLTESMR